MISPIAAGLEQPLQAVTPVTLRHAARWPTPSAVLIIVEYDAERANPWAPHPLPWSRLPHAADCAGFQDVRLLASVPSEYTAACTRPHAESRRARPLAHRDSHAVFASPATTAASLSKISFKPSSSPTSQ